MSKNVIKAVLEAKLMVLDYSISLLPNKLQGSLNSLKHDFIKAANEVTREYTEKDFEQKEKKEVKSITIE